MSSGKLNALLALTLTPGLGPTLIARCLDALGPAESLLHTIQHHPDRLTAIKGISPKGANAIQAGLRQVFDDDLVQRELDRIEKHNAHLLPIDDPRYPALLRHIPDPPPLLWVKGQLTEDDALALGIVGSRKATHYGREQAHRIAADAARARLTVVSGGAYGIDAAAHQGCLDAQGRTLAVIGSGLAKPYPQDHTELFARIIEPDDTGQPRGAVLSELPLLTPPHASHFPRRNRIISGLALGTLVVEAALRSGALITARQCAEDHGRELMVLPGRVDSRQSAGCHKILREGWGTLVTSIADILDTLGETGQLLKAQTIAENQSATQNAPETADASPTTPVHQSILDNLTDPRSLDELIALTSLDASTLRAQLTLLEIQGRIQRTGALFKRKS
ncbi:MAG: DNA-processing protein DprA [Planctomycetota bacterium]